jgi:hypothetical protein
LDAAQTRTLSVKSVEMFKGKSSKRRPYTAGIRHVFHGVAVKPSGDYRCSAVAAIEGQRFLSDEAPPLPLKNCEMPHACKCVYEHFNDRRTEGRRDSDFGLPSRYQAVDRRMQMRRITDRA